MKALCEKIEVYGFRRALEGMRNPEESWRKSDSTYWGSNPMVDDGSFSIFAPERPLLGSEDLHLACKLITAGSDHRKFCRQIMVWVDFNLPRFLWQEADTYKVGTTRDSCSTMHTIHRRDLGADDFVDGDVAQETLADINALIAVYKGDKSPENLHRLKAHITEGFLQRATYTMSYETCFNMYFARRNHRMKEWSGPDGICAMIAQLPLMSVFLPAYEKPMLEAAQNKKLLGDLICLLSQQVIGDEGAVDTLKRVIAERDALDNQVKAVGSALELEANRE